MIDFDTSEVVDMSYMFCSCKIHEGFSLGARFNTSNVKNMSFMFSNCKIPSNFSLGDKFGTSKVKDIRKQTPTIIRAAIQQSSDAEYYVDRA